MIAIPDRIWAKVNKTGPIPEHHPALGPCWEWTGARMDGVGLGVWRTGSASTGTRRMLRADITMFEAEGGVLVVGASLRHLCKNRGCVRPSHMDVIEPLPPVRTGERFGRWLIVAGPVVASTSTQDPSTHWWVTCSCARVSRLVREIALRNGGSASCGCVAMEKRTRHGGSRTSEYHIRSGMIDRCTRQAAREYPDYGGRGIRVCERWLESFASFLADIGPRPSPEHELDRIKNDGNYEPGNVRWATPTMQARNRRSNRFIVIAGERMTLAEASERFGVSRRALAYRLDAGLAPEAAVLAPAKNVVCT